MNNNLVGLGLSFGLGFHRHLFFEHAIRQDYMVGHHCLEHRLIANFMSIPDSHVLASC